MITGFADTNILIELYRNRPAANLWAAGQTDLAISAITWLEFMEGARPERPQKKCGPCRSQEPPEAVRDGKTSNPNRTRKRQTSTFGYSHRWFAP
jgi:hypothetical protein